MQDPGYKKKEVMTGITFQKLVVDNLKGPQSAQNDASHNQKSISMTSMLNNLLNSGR